VNFAVARARQRRKQGEDAIAKAEASDCNVEELQAALALAITADEERKMDALVIRCAC
jgi:hypothetical protein